LKSAGHFSIVPHSARHFGPDVDLYFDFDSDFDFDIDIDFDSDFVAAACFLGGRFCRSFLP